MEKFFIRYHLVGEKVVTDTREFESFGEAVSRISSGLKNDVIGVVKKNNHVVEIQTRHITHHEVMSEKLAKIEREINQISNIMKKR